MKSPLSIALVGLVLAPAVLAQTPFYFRGDGQLLPPQLRGPDDHEVELADLTTPEFLWAFHRDALLAPAAIAPLPAALQTQVVAALQQATEEREPGVRWQALWSLARIARTDAATAAVVRDRVLTGKLLDVPGPVGDVALVALGLAAHGDTKAMAALVATATRQTLEPSRRAYAFYGLGLAAQESSAAVVQFRVLAAVENSLLASSDAPLELRIAALHALAMVRLEQAPDVSAPALALLERLWQEGAPTTPVVPDVHAHVPIAVAAMLPRDADSAELWRERFAALAQDPGAAIGRRRVAVLALGALCRPFDADDSPEADCGALLQSLAKDARDVQMRYYAFYAAGRQGGTRQREFLRQGLAANFLVKPWAAFGLAALAARGAAKDDELASALATAANGMKNRDVLQALRAASAVAERQPTADRAQAFEQRYHARCPGMDQPAELATASIAELGDAKAPADRRARAAMLLGHLADISPQHWSARLAAAIDYRNPTRELLGMPHGVLRLP